MRRELRAYLEAELRNYNQNKTDLDSMMLMTSKRLLRVEQIITAIETVVESLPPEKHQLVELKYWARPQMLNSEGIASQLHCDRRTVYRWIDGILSDIATELGEHEMKGVG